MPTKSNDALIQEVIDREAIRTLPVRYCHCVWQKDPDAWASLFTDDGEISTNDPSMPRAQGREALRKMIASGLETSQPRPFIHNHIVELLGPDSAKGTCYVEVRLLRDGKKHYMSGWYNDEYAKVNGEWKFKSRRINVDSMTPTQ
jgi:uncharacterized protein (TIGR02246 family)